MRYATENYKRGRYLQQPGRLKQTTNTGLEVQRLAALMISPDTDRREVAPRSIGCIVILLSLKNKNVRYPAPIKNDEVNPKAQALAIAQLLAA
jgi:hypothetical protein